jgi:heterodisulfide reductase subunit C
MKKFGYTITRDRQIDYDADSTVIKDYIRDHEPTLEICIGCGSCTATCSAGHFTDLNIRKIHTLIRRNQVEDLKKEIEKCMLCGKCQLVCPRGVNLRNLILSIHSALEKAGA